MISPGQFSDLFARIQTSIRYRLSLIFSAMFRRGKYLPPHYKVVVERPVVYGWANVFDLLTHAKCWQEEPRPEFAALCRTQEDNPQSTEQDVAHLLYNLVRMIKAQRVIEVGIYRGAGSLHLAQGLADNGGGELHLVDISVESLAEVEEKIRKAKFPIVTSLHCGDSASIAREGRLPLADLIFLDAEHRYEPVQQDIACYWQLVSEGGLLVIHDTVMWEGTRRSANELFAGGYTICTLASSEGSGVSIVFKTRDKAPRAQITTD